MKVTGNVKYIPAGTTQYIVDGSDGEINVDTSLSAITIILPNIINSGYTNSDKGFIINDISGNAATNNITIIAANNTVNSQSSVLISTNGGSAKCSIASMNEWFIVTEPSSSGMSGSLTAGYIPRAVSASALADSVIYQNSGKIGINTTNPLTNFHVSGTNASSIILSTRYSSDNASSGFIAAKARGTEAAPSGILLGDKMLNVSAYGYTSAGAFSTEVGKMVFYATEDFTGSANGTAFKISTTPIGATVDVFNFGINENGYVSIGDTNLAPTARLHVTGVSATSSDYALKVDNLVGSPLLYVRNDNAVSIGTTPVVDSRLQINNSVFGKASISLGGADYYGIDVNTTGLSMLLGVNTSNNKQLWLADQDKLASNGTNPVLQFGLFGVSPSAINALSTNGSYLDLVLQSNGGNVGISTGVINPTARLHVKGNSAPGDFTFKAEDAGGNLLLYVRNDGLISAALLPTSNAGLSTGDMYVDTAANILSNGDKVVGWKV